MQSKQLTFKDLKKKDPRLGLTRILDIFNYDEIQYISKFQPESNIEKEKDPVISFILKALYNIKEYPKLNFLELLGHIQQTLASKLNLAYPFSDFDKVPYNKLQRITGNNYHEIYSALIGSSVDGDVGVLYNLIDALEYGFILSDSNSAFANLHSLHELQNMLIRVMINDGKHILQTSQELIENLQGILTQEDLNHLERICMDEQRYLAVKNILLLHIRAHSLEKKKFVSNETISILSPSLQEKMILTPDENPVYMSKGEIRKFIREKGPGKVNEHSVNLISVTLNINTSEKIKEISEWTEISRSQIMAQIINALKVSELSPENKDKFERFYGFLSVPMNVTQKKRYSFSVSNYLYDKFQLMAKNIKDYEKKMNRVQKYGGYLTFFIDVFYYQLKKALNKK